MTNKTNFKKIDLESFEHIGLACEYNQSEIDGHKVTVAYHNDNVVGVYYHAKYYGTKNVDFNSSDLIAYVEADPFFPDDWS